MIRLAALLLTVLTGFSGLVYEVTWEKYLATLLGSHSEATAAVLGFFLGGLAVGYALFGAVTRRLVARARAEERSPRLLVVYGALEASIGVYALCFPLLFSGVRAVSHLVPAGNPGLAFAFDALLSALLIVPPAVLMGGTIPMLTQALAKNLDDATRFHALVYGFNTAGAFSGALAAGFWLIPQLGLVGTLVAMACVNLTAGAVFVALGVRSAPVATPQAPSPARALEGFAQLAAVALLVGFAMMTLQTVLIRLGALSLGASQFTFSMVVAVFVLCIALGSFAVSALPRIPAALLVVDLWGLFLLLYLLYAELDDAPYYAHALRSLFRSSPAAFYPYHLSAFAGALAVIGLPVALSGATLPLIFHQLRREFGDLGESAGRIYSWNTLGSLLGALLGGYALLFWLDLHEVYRLAMAALAIAAVLATTRVLDLGRAVAAGLLIPAIGALALLPAWEPTQLSAGLFRAREPQAATWKGPEAFFSAKNSAILRFYRDDPTSSVAVKEYPRNDGRLDRSIVTNGKSDGSTIHDYPTMALAALLPALLAERAERAFVIGYGTGVTAGEFAALDSAREVVVSEISSGVVEAAPLFEFANLSVSQQPEVRIERSDAYRALLRSEGGFDVIASEPSNPWVIGVEMLYSREFLTAARDRLSPGGVYAQWFHVYETNAGAVAMVLRTFASVFDHVTVWFAQGPDLLLIGMRDPANATDLDRLERRAARSDFAAGLRRCGIRSLPTLLAHELLPLGVVRATPLHGKLHTLLHPRLSYRAARAFFTGGQGRLPRTAGLEAALVGRRNSLVQRYAARYGGRLPRPARVKMVRETCKHRPQECVTLLAQWAHEEPNSSQRTRVHREIVERVLGAVSATSTPIVFDDNVEQIAQLYGGAAAAVAGGDPLAYAMRATNLFRDFYHHAAPFPRPVLAALWDRCEAEPVRRERCQTARAVAEQSLGPLRVDGQPAAP